MSFASKNFSVSIFKLAFLLNLSNLLKAKKELTMSQIKNFLQNIPGVQRFYRSFKYVKHIHEFDQYLHEYPYQIQRLEEFTSSPFLTFSPPGHFYSPIPGESEIKRQKESKFQKASSKCYGVDLNEGNQLELLFKLSNHYAQLPYPESPISTC